ncbi:MAG: hypothetical protein ABSD85_05975 [Acidimicrobiales bacterium]|jgi:hypothetical protein
MVDVELLYREHLSETDRQLLSKAVGAQVPLSAALGSPAVEAVVFGPGETALVSVAVSPFLAFATAVHRTAAALETASFVEERWAPRVRIPVFDVVALRALVSDPLRRYFLIELLASYTRVASGVTWTRTARGWRRRRFSELEPARLAELLEVVGVAERSGVYRRLGDLALFLLGVFPDYLPALGSGVDHDRLLRLSGLGAESAADLGTQDILELLGARWYAAAVSAATANGSPVTATLAVAGHIAEHFRDARRVLNAVTDRYLFPLRERWFGTG